jgi:hypothetical protein
MYQPEIFADLCHASGAYPQDGMEGHASPSLFGPGDAKAFVPPLLILKNEKIAGRYE